MLPSSLLENYLSGLEATSYLGCPPFSKVFHNGLRLLLYFFHKGSHDHLLALYFLHESLKFVKIIREKNRHIHVTFTPSFHLFNGAIGWIPLLSYWRFITFSICSTKARNLPSYAASATSDPKSGDSTVVLVLNFGGILQ